MRLTQLLQTMSKCHFRIAAVRALGPRESSGSVATTSAPQGLRGTASHAPVRLTAAGGTCSSRSMQRGHTEAPGLRTADGSPTQPDSNTKRTASRAGRAASGTCSRLFTRLSSRSDKHNQDKSAAIPRVTSGEPSCVGWKAG